MYIIGQMKMSGSIGAVKMTGFTSIAFLICFACSAALEVQEEETTTTTTTTTTAPEDVARRELTDAGYVIRYNDEVYPYPLRVSPVVVREGAKEGGPEETNEIETEEEDRRRPLFYFTTYEAVESDPRGRFPDSRPYIEIRKKRELNSTEIPESSKVGKLRRKRTYCGRCGYGGYRKVYVPVTYVVYPVHYGGGGGGGKGCYTCGGGYGGGGGGSYSFSSSHSSAGSFSWGK